MPSRRRCGVPSVSPGETLPPADPFRPRLRSHSGVPGGSPIRWGGQSLARCCLPAGQVIPKSAQDRLCPPRRKCGVPSVSPRETLPQGGSIPPEDVKSYWGPRRIADPLGWAKPCPALSACWTSNSEICTGSVWLPSGGVGRPAAQSERVGFPAAHLSRQDPTAPTSISNRKSVLCDPSIKSKRISPARGRAHLSQKE